MDVMETTSPTAMALRNFSIVAATDTESSWVWATTRNPRPNRVALFRRRWKDLGNSPRQQPWAYRSAVAYIDDGGGGVGPNGDDLAVIPASTEGKDSRTLNAVVS